MNNPTLFPPFLNRRSANGTAVDPALQHESNTHLLQVLQNNVSSLGKAAASNATRLIAGFIVMAVVAAFSLAAFSMGTFNTVSILNTYQPLTNRLSDAIFGDDAPLLIAPPYNASLQCPTTSGRADLCTYFSYVNHSIAVFNQFMINGTVDNDTLSTLPYTNAAPFMSGVNNGKTALDALVTEVTAVSAAGGINAAAIAALESSVGSTYYVERAAAGGADTPTCGRQPLFPCATPAYALTHVAAMASPNVSFVLQLGAGLFVAPALALPCNLALHGRGAATTLVAAGFSIGSGSACANVIADVHIQLTAASNLILQSLAMRNVTFLGAPIYPLAITGPASPIGEVVLDNIDLAGVSLFSVQDAEVDARTVLHGRAVSINYTVAGGSAELHDFQIGSTSFSFSTAATGVTSTLMGYGWSNPTTAPWTISTAAGSTTIFRGDDGAIGLINANATFYGPISAGGGTLTVQRESGAIGQAYVATAPATWAVSGVPVQTNDALDKISSRVFAVENTAGRDITIFTGFAAFTGSTCNTAFPPLFSFAGTTKNVAGIDYFSETYGRLKYDGVVQASFRVTLTFHAIVAYGASGYNAGTGWCLRSFYGACTGEYPNLPFALNPSGTTQVVGYSLDRIFTFLPTSEHTLQLYADISTITSCDIILDSVQLDFIEF